MNELRNINQIENCITTARYWKDFIHEKGIGQSDYIIILANSDKDVNYYTLHFLGDFCYRNNTRKLLILADNEDMKSFVERYATAKYEFYVCESQLIDGLCRIQSKNPIFNHILINEFNKTEDVDAFSLAGLRGIEKKDIVAKGILRLRDVPSEEEIKRGQLSFNRNYKRIDWTLNQRWIPRDEVGCAPREEFCKCALSQLSSNHHISANKSIYIFGKTLTANIIREALQEQNYKVSGILDNKAEDKETYIGLPVYVPESVLLPFNDKNRILVSIVKYREVCEQLYACGYELGKHVFLLNNSIALMDENPNIDLDIEDLRTKMRKGLSVYRNIREAYSCSTLMICPYKGTGDIYLLNMYLPEYMVEHNMTDVKFIVPTMTLKKIALLFGVDSVVINMSDMENLIYYIHAIGKENLNARILDINIFQAKNDIIHAIMGLDYNTMLQKLLFKQSSRKYKPQFYQDNADLLIDKYHICSDKTMILSPYAVTVKNLPQDFWVVLAEKLKRQGYDVFTNIASDAEKAIEGTTSIFIPFSQILSFMENVKCFIGLRSGLCDIISSTKSKMIVLYTENKELNLYGLENMGLKSQNILEIIYDGFDAGEAGNAEIMKRILEFMEE